MLNIYRQDFMTDNASIVGSKESLHLLAMKIIEAINYGQSTLETVDSAAIGYSVNLINLEDSEKWAILRAPYSEEAYGGLEPESLRELI